MPSRMPSTISSDERSKSVSSMRRMSVPLKWRAKSQLKRAVRAPPTCRYPVGEGAKRTRGAVTVSDILKIESCFDATGICALCPSQRPLLLQRHAVELCEPPNWIFAYMIGRIPRRPVVEKFNPRIGIRRKLRIALDLVFKLRLQLGVLLHHLTGQLF